MSEKRLNVRKRRRGTQWASGGERGRDILDSRAVRSMEFSNYVLPSHVMVTWVALWLESDRVGT